jgi:hypothetical protein
MLRTGTGNTEMSLLAYLNIMVNRENPTELPNDKLFFIFCLFSDTGFLSFFLF